MVLRRQVVEYLKGFRVDVGITGRGLARGDETNLVVRARQNIPDFKTFYHPDIYVYHLTRSQLFSMSYLIRRAFAQGRHNHLVWEQENQQASKSQLLLEMARRLYNFGRSLAYGVVRRDRTQFPYLQNYIYERLLKDIEGLGMLFYTHWK